MKDTFPFENTPLPYGYDSLEPFIDGETIKIHHGELLQGYVSRLNEVLSKYPFLQKLTLDRLIDLYCHSGTIRHGAWENIPRVDIIKLCRSAGGVYCHRLYFESMTPGAKKRPRGCLAGAINRAFGDFENFSERFSAAALSVFGSGYAWLAMRGTEPVILTSANQDVIPACPLLNLDVWEHSYFLKYHGGRDKYVKAWWNIVNWSAAEARYQSCLSRFF